MEEANLDQNLANGIAMLEQILEVMPQDEEALRAVYAAHVKRGQADRAFDYLVRLSEVAAHDGAAETLEFVRGQLARFAPARPDEVAARLERLDMLASLAPPSGAVATPEEAPAAAAETGGGEVDIGEELALAWRLYEENQLTQEEYSSVLHDLTEISSKELDVPVSVLHVLNDRGFTQLNRVMSHLSLRSATPFVSLADFELSGPVATILPPRFAARDGALPFGTMGDTLLVAVLNPFDHQLVDRVEAAAGRRCHTYLVGPEDYDAALGRLRKLSEAA